MKVYIITSGEYSGYMIEEVFTDRETAELYCAIHEDCQIEEFNTDTVKLEGKVYRAVKFYGHKYLSKQEWVFKKDIDWVEQIYDTEPITEDFLSQFNGTQYVCKFVIPVNKSLTDKQARKIANDKWKQFIAEKENL